MLVKFLFTTDKLSVQVHPSDHYAMQNERSAGKTEMWHVLQAEPGARIAIGFRKEFLRVDRETLRRAMQSGEIEQMLDWLEAYAGDTFFVPAGTVHAIGAGIVLCEIQQNSDVTYRLYDYMRPGTDGRPRQLHLERGVDVIRQQTSGGRTVPLEYTSQQGIRLCLAACPYFATEKMTLDSPAQYEIQYESKDRFEIWIGLEGEAQFEAAQGAASCGKGEAVIIPADCGPFRVRPNTRSVFLRTYQPDLDRDVIAPLRAQGYSDLQLRQVCFDCATLAKGDAA